MNLQTLYDLQKTLGNTLQGKVIRNFIESLAIELLNDKLNDTEPIDTEIFLCDLKSEIKDQEQQITLTEDSHLVVEYAAYCEFEYNKVDETDNGGGLKGDVCDVDTYDIEIEKVTLYLFEGSVFEIDNNKLNEILIEAITL